MPPWPAWPDAASGAGSAVNEFLISAGLTTRVVNLGLPDRFIDHGEQGQLLAELGLDEEGIVRAVLRKALGEDKANLLLQAIANAGVDDAAKVKASFLAAVAHGDVQVGLISKTKATELFAKMQAVVDTIADKGIFHKNKAARHKSRLSAKIKALAA